MHLKPVHNEPVKLPSHHDRRLTNRRQPFARALHDLRIGPRRRHDLDCVDEVGGLIGCATRQRDLPASSALMRDGRIPELELAKTAFFSDAASSFANISRLTPRSSGTFSCT